MGGFFAGWGYILHCVTWFLPYTFGKLKQKYKNCWKLYCTELCLESKKAGIHLGTQGP